MGEVWVIYVTTEVPLPHTQMLGLLFLCKSTSILSQVSFTERLHLSLALVSSVAVCVVNKVTATSLDFQSVPEGGI